MRFAAKPRNRQMKFRSPCVCLSSVHRSRHRLEKAQYITIIETDRRERGRRTRADRNTRMKSEQLAARRTYASSWFSADSIEATFRTFIAINATKGRQRCELLSISILFETHFSYFHRAEDGETCSGISCHVLLEAIHFWYQQSVFISSHLSLQKYFMRFW